RPRSSSSSARGSRPALRSSRRSPREPGRATRPCRRCTAYRPGRARGPPARGPPSPPRSAGPAGPSSPRSGTRSGRGPGTGLWLRRSSQLDVELDRRVVGEEHALFAPALVGPNAQRRRLRAAYEDVVDAAVGAVRREVEVAADDRGAAGELRDDALDLG